jgi:phage/plasmid primase-like uncharacterized protein
MFDPELESFKTRIDLRAYAAGEGYVLDRKESWRGSAVMRHANGDKVVVSRQPDGHYTFFSVRADHDSGTIIDFIQKRKGLSLGAIRKELRGWVGMQAKAVLNLPDLSKTAKDRHAVQARYASMQSARCHPYLETERGIPALALHHWRFDGRIKTDRHANAVFPHYDRDGLCGYELRNAGFKGFASGGTKGLWLSKNCEADRRLVICESAIDAISFAVLYSDGHARYASIGGKMNPQQPGLIRDQIALLPQSSEVVAAMDADDAGRHLAQVIRTALDAAARADLSFRQEEPQGFKDWNDQLLAKFRRPLPRGAKEPSVV